MAITIFQSEIAGIAQGVVAELGEVPLTSAKAYIGGSTRLTFRIGAEYYDEAFDNWLGNHMEDSHGKLFWRGFVGQVDRVSGWIRERRSLIDSEKPVYNAIRVDYDGGITAWGEDDDSIGRYGRIEKTLSATTLSSANAIVRRDNALSEHSKPEAFFVTTNASYVDEAFVEVTCVGYQATMAFRESSISFSGSVDIATVVKLMLSTDCPHLTAGWIKNTGVTVSLSELKSGNSWVKLVDLMALLPNQWRFVVGKKVHLWDTGGTVLYQVSKDAVRTFRGSRDLAPWEVSPGVFQFETGASVRTVLVKDVQWSTASPMPRFGDSVALDGVYYGAI